MLKFYLKQQDGKLYLDSCLAEETRPNGFVKWVDKSDITIIPPDIKELCRQSDEYWRQRYQNAGG